jgi:hypothetical protein
LQYRTYWNRNASDSDVIRWSHYGVIFFALFASAFSTMLHYVGVDLGWTLYMLGVLTCPGIFPTTFTILWRRQSRAAAIISPLLGMTTGIAVWLGTAYSLYGTVTISTTGATVPCVWGTVASALSPIPYTVIITLIKPEYFDWAEFRKEHLAFEANTAPIIDTQLDSSITRSSASRAVDPEAGTSQAQLKRWSRIAVIWALATFFGHWVLWPLPMYASKYVFGKGFFVAWLVISMIWLWGTLFIVGFYPILDGWSQISEVGRGFWSGTKNQEGSGSVVGGGDDTWEVVEDKA